MKNIVKTEYTIYSDKLNNDYKAILLSDLHYGVSLNDNELKKYCDEISELNPDFVFLGGDIVDERTSEEEMKSAFNILSSINSKYGIYYIYGNHDKNMYSNNKTFTLEELERTIRDNNIIILEEDKKYINDDVILIGRGYDVRKNLDEIISDEDSSFYSILIDHVPLEYKSNREKGINLELSGHTHNGQIFPLGLMQKAYNFIASDDKTDSEINNIHNLSDLVYGIYQKDDFTAIVSSGMAGWAIPIRTESRSEYVVINIKSKN
ncbi:MAG: metallophosphoesterase [Bacilli bacterium]|nr:metallophosphoesterase [Bacilli bacterium]